MTFPPPLPGTPSPKSEPGFAANAKAALRREIRQQRRATIGADPGARAADLAAAVLAHPEVAQRVYPGAVVLAHVSLPTEPPTAELRRLLRERGATVLLPVAEERGRLTWVLDPGDTAAAWGVPGHPTTPGDGVRRVVPVDPDVVLVPALAATADGRRLGQGGGYYDRFLVATPALADGGPLLVGIVGPGELVAELPTEDHDRRVDVVIVG